MEYSIKETFIDIFGKKELIDVIDAQSYEFACDQPKPSNLLKFKDKFLKEVFGDFGGVHNHTSINNLFHKNDPKWGDMTTHIQNVLSQNKNSTVIFKKFQKIMTIYRDKYPDKYEEIFNDRKSSFNIFYENDLRREGISLRINSSFEVDDLIGKPLDSNLKNIIKKLSDIDDQNAFEYMVFLFILISIFHDTLSSNTKLQHLYDEKYMVKCVPGFSLSSTETFKKEKVQQKLLSSPKPIPKTLNDIEFTRIAHRKWLDWYTGLYYCYYHRSEGDTVERKYGLIKISQNADQYICQAILGMKQEKFNNLGDISSIQSLVSLHDNSQNPFEFFYDGTLFLQSESIIVHLIPRTNTFTKILVIKRQEEHSPFKSYLGDVIGMVTTTHTASPTKYQQLAISKNKLKNDSDVDNFLVLNNHNDLVVKNKEENHNSWADLILKS